MIRNRGQMRGQRCTVDAREILSRLMEGCAAGGGCKRWALRQLVPKVVRRRCYWGRRVTDLGGNGCETGEDL